MVEVGTLLYFIPPYFASGQENIKRKKRLMLVIENNAQDKTFTLINVSKFEDKPNCLTYPFNCLIKNYNPPLPLLSFAKLNDNYIIEDFNELSGFLYKGGAKLDLAEFNNITLRHKNYKNNNRLEMISFTRDELLLAN